MDNFDKPSPQPLDNPYIVIPEEKEIRQRSFTKGIFPTFVPIFLIIFLLVYPMVLAIQSEMPYLISLIAIPIFLLLFFCKCRIVLIKDKVNNRLTIKEKNFFCCGKSYSIPLEFADIKTSSFGAESGPCCRHELSNIIVVNANPNVTDIDNNNIKNTPYKLIYRFSNLIGSQRDLSLELENFIGNKFTNNIKEEINLYVPKKNQENNNFFNLGINFSNFYRTTETFIKISDHFYMFYNYNYISSKSSKESFRRLDWIYTNDFDRIFLGVVKNDKSYVNTFTYNLDSIDKFILEIRDGKYCLKIILKGGLDTEICRYTRESEKKLNTFIYLINGQINKINNKNNPDYPEVPDNSAPTLV